MASDKPQLPWYSDPDSSWPVKAAKQKRGPRFIVSQIESVEFHLSPEDQERSYRRRALMRRYDVELVEHRPSQLRREPRQVRDDLWVAYERALRRPRPALIARAPAA